MKIWHAEKIGLEKGFPTNPNMTYFAEIIAFKIDTSKIFFDFSTFAVQKELVKLDLLNHTFSEVEYML